MHNSRITYPRVTEIIGKQTVEAFQAIPPDLLSQAAYRGTEVHAYASAWATGAWLPDLDNSYDPYYRAFEAWADQSISKVIRTDERLYDDVKRFTGEFDMIVDIDGKRTLLDIKTSSAPSPSWKVQLGAYALLLERNEIEVEEYAILHLKKKKSRGEETASPLIVPDFKSFTSDIEEGKEIFSSCLRCYDYFHRKKRC